MFVCGSFMSFPYLCPICSAALLQEKSRWYCANNHSFDVAKQRYVNLLPVQHKKSLAPGDAADMVVAREAFLSAGYYQPLQHALVEAIDPWQAKHLLDVGCGEGYYTQAMCNVVKQVTAFDIAKSAVMKTAKKLVKQGGKDESNYRCLVASAAHVPLADASVDVVTSIFSPILPDELNRVLTESGKLVIAKPAEQHLLALRELLFDDVILHDSDKFIEQLAPTFTLEQKRPVTCELDLDTAAINQLLTMTPYAYKAKPEKRDAVEKLETLKVTAHFYVYVFTKNAE